jgi:hypothetical protein
MGADTGVSQSCYVPPDIRCVGYLVVLPGEGLTAKEK